VAVPDPAGPAGRAALEEVVEGVLSCAGCGRAYPVLDAIPRLCPEPAPSESAALERLAATAEPVLERLPAPPADPYAKIEELVRAKSALSREAGEYARQRTENDVRFRVRECEKQDKYANTLRRHFDRRPGTLLDVGGGQGGLIKCLSERFQPALAILVDYDLEWAEVTRLRCPDVEVVKADATRLPLRSDAIDLVVSQAVLEHVEAYDAALDELARVTRGTLLLSWGPTRFSAYDLAHLDAPITLLPKAVGRQVAFLWHRLRRTGITMRAIDDGLRTTFYISTPHVRRRLARHGRVRNVFAEFMAFSLQSDYAFNLQGAREFLRRHPALASLLLRAIAALHVEPNGYFVMEKRPTSTNISFAASPGSSAAQ
jgi:SAM-dependent methyltransferase